MGMKSHGLNLGKGVYFRRHIALGQWAFGFDDSTDICIHGV